MKILGIYKNGNYTTTILSDGSKIRETRENEFIPSFSENCDCKITNQCDMNCPYCHEGSTKDGVYGDILNQEFLDTLHPFTEIAIGGGNPLSHPDLIKFLTKLKHKKVISNITVNQQHFEQNKDLLHELTNKKLIYGLGVSLNKPSEILVESLQEFPNAVLHVINGIFNANNLEILQNKNLKMLILGYKDLRRGTEWLKEWHEDISENQKWLYDNIQNIISAFNVVSFDNLSIEQLDVRRLMTQEEWDQFYMGDDGTMTFHIDLVEQKFAKSSVSTNRYGLLKNIDDMFSIVRKEEKWN